MKPSSIDSYALAFERHSRTISKIPVRVVEASTEGISGAFVNGEENTDPSSNNTNSKANNDENYYYCSIRMGDKNISVKLRVSLIAYMVVVLGIEGDDISKLRREIQKVLYKILKGCKKSVGVNAIITDKVLEYLIMKKEDRVLSTDYRIYCGKLGGQVNASDVEYSRESDGSECSD